MIMKYKISEYAKLNKVGYRTIWNWIKLNKVQIERTTTGRVMIIVEDDDIKESVAVYCRVSSSENKDNLERQKERVLNYCAAKGYQIDKVIIEIGSGLNDNRQKLEKLLLDPSITKIVVEHSDRFSRFGMNYIQKLLTMQGRIIEIINKQENNRDDLMQDFVSIITSFTARLYGQRRTKRKTEQLIKAIEDNKCN